MYRVRFHLAKGQHYRHWQVRHPDGSKTYHDPATTQLTMFGCHLRNSRRVADRIHAGAHKTVCAWVLCSDVSIAPTWPDVEPPDGRIVTFHPRALPYWHLLDGTNMDGTEHDEITTHGRTLYALQREFWRVGDCVW